MTVHIHRLEGCSPTPLARYLKALAILRLVAEQRDERARGWWKNEAFSLATELSREELMRFFMEEYAPTPILSPWNRGSGFFYDNDVGLMPLERSTAPRFATLRHGIAAARAMCAPLADVIGRIKTLEEAGADLGAMKVANAERERLKNALLATCRRRWSGGLLEWFDAALALDADGSASWPALLGSGGNDGRLDFTNNSMQHLSTLFDCGAAQGGPTACASPLLGASLWSEVAPGLLRRAVGQFFPGQAGGDNMGSGFVGGAAVNPWDFVLMLEGTVLLRSSLVRSSDATGLPQAAAPFAVRASGSGYGSAAVADEGPRGEQWMPLWSLPATIAEVRGLFAEGRTRVGRRTSVRALDVARAAGRLGAARGVTSFERYAYIERNGQSTLAVPIGRWAISSQPHEQLLDDIDAWLGNLRAVARDVHAPKAITSAAWALDEALFAACKSGVSPVRWQTLLAALGRAEGALVRSPRTVGDPKRRLAPLPPLRPEWLSAADDGSAEFRLAVALASQDAVVRSPKAGEVFVNVRAHWLPLDRSGAPRLRHGERRPAKFAVDSNGLTHDPDVTCVSGHLETDCIALVRRRIQMAPTLADRVLGLFGARGAEATLADVMAFLACEVDDARILALARSLMAVTWWEKNRPRLAAPHYEFIDANYAVVRITHLSELLDRGQKGAIPLDPEPIARLASGDLAAAIHTCLRRLRTSGLEPVVRSGVGSSAFARRIAASLAFPIRSSDAVRCADLVTKPYVMEAPSNAH